MYRVHFWTKDGREHSHVLLANDAAHAMAIMRRRGVNLFGFIEELSVQIHEARDVVLRVQGI